MDWTEQGESLADGYHQFLVPAMFIPCAAMLLDAAEIAPGATVLDVACGTGVVTRAAAQRAGSGGSVVGVDLGEAMLGVARSQPAEDGAAPIDYRQGDAGDLPVDDGAFDVALCQHGIMFFPDRPAAVAAMARALRPGGTVAIAAWSSLEKMTPFAALYRALREHISEEAATMIASPFAVGADELERLLDGAGFEDVELSERGIDATYSSHRDFAERVLLAGPVGPAYLAADEHARRAVGEQVAADLEPYAGEGDRLTAPISTHIAVARKPG